MRNSYHTQLMLMRGCERYWRCDWNSWPVTGDRLRITGVDAVRLDVIAHVLAAAEKIRLAVGPDDAGTGGRPESRPVTGNRCWITVVDAIFLDIIAHVLIVVKKIGLAVWPDKAALNIIPHC